MNDLKISNISITPIKPTPKGLVAFCQFNLNDVFFIGNVAIYSCLKDNKDYRLVYPQRTIKTGAEINSFCPIDRKAGDKIEKAVIEKLETMNNK